MRTNISSPGYWSMERPPEALPDSTPGPGKPFFEATARHPRPVPLQKAPTSTSARVWMRSEYSSDATTRFWLLFLPPPREAAPLNSYFISYRLSRAFIKEGCKDRGRKAGGDLLNTKQQQNSSPPAQQGPALRSALKIPACSMGRNPHYVCCAHQGRHPNERKDV